MFLRAPFQTNDIQKILSFLQTQSFATLVGTSDSKGIIASHLPVDLLSDSNCRYFILLNFPLYYDVLLPFVDINPSQTTPQLLDLDLLVIVTVRYFVAT